MAYIVTALHCEAAPLIEHWGLRRTIHHRAFHLFRGDAAGLPVELIVSGIGKVRSAVATAVLAASSNAETPIIVNVGVAGAQPTRQRGEIVYAHRIVDHASGSAWIPDSVLDHPFSEGELTTFEHPVTTETPAQSSLDLVDMEGSGFAEAAALYTAPSAWAALKVVSDHFSPSELSRDGIEALIAPHAASIDEFVRSLVAQHGSGKFAFAPDDNAVLTELLGAYRFTASQKQILKTAAREYVLKNGAGLVMLKRFLQREPATKADLKELFQEAHRALTTA